MSAFSESEIKANRFVWQLFRDGPVSLVHHESRLAELLNDLITAGYAVYEIYVSTHNLGEFDKTLRSELKFPTDTPSDVSLDAIRVFLEDLLHRVDKTGIVVVIRHIQKLNQIAPDYLQRLTHIFTIEARFRMLLGERLALLLQTDDPDLKLSAIGCYQPQRILGDFGLDVPGYTHLA